MTMIYTYYIFINNLLAHNKGCCPINSRFIIATIIQSHTGTQGAMSRRSICCKATERTVQISKRVNYCYDIPLQESLQQLLNNEAIYQQVNIIYNTPYTLK